MILRELLTNQSQEFRPNDLPTLQPRLRPRQKLPSQNHQKLALASPVIEDD